MRNSLRKVIIVLILALAAVLAGVIVIHKTGIDVPYLCYSGPGEGIWSIGIYDLEEKDGRLKPMARETNPVLTAADVRDMQARFVADPFLVREKGHYYLFFEALGVDNGVISLASSKDGHRWIYRGIVLEEPFHLSYPCVFQWQDDYYMIPESIAVNSIRLYRATEFPVGWRFVETIIADRPLVDPTVLVHNGILCLFAASRDNGDLRLFFADRPEGPWQEHPESPVIRNNGRDARPAGNILNTGSRLIRFAQDSQAHGEKYGKAVRGFEILKLTVDEYRERPLAENPLLKESGNGWNATGMHHISTSETASGRWMAAVDGKRRSGQWVFCLGRSVFRVP